MNLSNEPTNRKNLPDVSVESRSELASTIHRVGMKRIEVPVRLEVDGQEFRIPALVDAFVSLDKPEAKGIHMSRLFLQVREKLESEVLTFDLLKSVTKSFLDSHQELSKTADVKVQFEMPVKRKALLSGEEGWRQYPVSLQMIRKSEEVQAQLEFEVVYSSTCPCSAALSRQLQQDQFSLDFADIERPSKKEVRDWLGKASSVGGVPHAQRSRAQVSLTLKPEDSEDVLDYIDLIEDSLGTPVQAAVKREDEQEFARLNAQNLMFCEDAGRKIKSALNAQSEILDFRAEVSHEESLHPHNAVSIVTKDTK